MIKMSTRPRGGSFEVDLGYRDARGKRRRLRYSYPDEEQARLAELRMRLAIEEGRDPRRESGRQRAPKNLAPETLGELREYCLRYVWSGTRGEDTAISFSNRIVEEMGSDVKIKAITPGSIRIATRGLESSGLAASSINRILGCLGKMLTTALEERWLDSKPRVPKVEEVDREARFLQEPELDRMFKGLREINETAHDLAVFLLWTGCRVGEALALDWEHIDLEHRRVTFVRTKTNRNRTVPIPQRAMNVLLRRWDGEQKPFLINQDTFGKQWNKAKARVGLIDKRVTPHTLRHTCASRMVMGGVSLYEVSKWLGHTSITTTQIYAHLAPDHLRGAADVLEHLYGPEAVAS